MKKQRANWPVIAATAMGWSWIYFVGFIFLPESWGYYRLMAAAVVATIMTGFLIVVLSGANEFDFKDRKEHW